MAWPFLKLGISANQVTMFWLAIALVGCAFLASGSYENMIIGAVLLELAIILDCVDGHIARFKGPKYSGEVLDTWAGEILLVLSLLSIGIGLSNNKAELITLDVISSLDVDKHVFLYVGIFAALASLSSWTVRVHWRTITMKMSLNSSEPDHDIRESGRALIADNLFHYSGALTVLMVASAILNAMDVILLLIALVYGLYLIAIMFRIVKKARMLDSSRRENTY
jgi:phosphatidylglycerophosphate synthase